ncbi:MAG: GNAT family N-acetyltransferase [Candidatus Dormibacteria bacterium]
MPEVPRVRLAGSGDVERVEDLLAEAAAHARERGFEQWPERFSTEFVAIGVARREVRVAELDGRVMACCWLLWQDLEFWGQDDGRAGYLHRLAAADRSRGTGVGRELLLWAQREVATAGREYLRLDCLAANRRLRRWYESLGFVHVRDRVMEPAADGSRPRALTVSLYQVAVRPPGGRRRAGA